MATIVYYPYGAGGGQAVVAGDQAGNVLNVPADGSSNISVTFASPYANAVSSVQLTPSVDTSVGVDMLSIQIVSVSLTGFTFLVTGGAPGKTCTVYWKASGS